MRIEFEILIDDSWVNVGHAIIMDSGKRLATVYGIVDLGKWRISRSTINSPVFRTALWNGLSSSEQEASLARRHPQPTS